MSVRRSRSVSGGWYWAVVLIVAGIWMPDFVRSAEKPSFLVIMADDLAR